MSTSNCIEYRIVDKRSKAVVRVATACSEEELELAKAMVDLINKKYGMSFEVVAKQRSRH